MSTPIKAVRHHVIAAAAAHSDMDDAIALVQRAAGITTGDVAGVFFADANISHEDWKGLTVFQRQALLTKYAFYERSQVTMMVAPSAPPLGAEGTVIRRFQVRNVSDQVDTGNGFDLIYHDDEAGVQRHSEEVFSTYEQAVTEADRLEAMGYQPTHWPLAYVL